MSTTETPTTAAAPAKKGFGSVFVDEMVVAKCENGQWTQPEVVPYEPISLDPATVCLHYGQTIFEGLKGHRQPNGDTAVFRLGDHMERLNNSARRMSMATIEPEVSARAVLELLARHTAETPEPPGSMYIRPMLIATDVGMGVKPSQKYSFMVLLTPVEDYFGGKAGIRMRTETHFSRAAPGGTGAAKAGGNYGASMIAQQAAVADGFDQVLWLDVYDRRYIEELSAMNFLMVKDGVLVSPPESETVLSSITNRSIFTLAQDLGIPNERRRIDIHEIADEGVTEVFCCGTAAIITPVFELVHEGKSLFHKEEKGPVATRLYDALTAVQQGTADDPHGWRTPCGAPA